MFALTTFAPLRPAEPPARGFRRVFRLCFGAVAVACLALGGPSLLFGSPADAAEAAGAAVRITNFAFAPASLTVPVGTTVTWVNQDDVPHTVAATGRAFKSKALDTDDSFTYRFSTPGSFDYFCSLHPQMVGKVVVQPAKPSS